MNEFYEKQKATLLESFTNLVHCEGGDGWGLIVVTKHFSINDLADYYNELECVKNYEYQRENRGDGSVCFSDHEECIAFISYKQYIEICTRPVFQAQGVSEFNFWDYILIL